MCDILKRILVINRLQGMSTEPEDATQAGPEPDEGEIPVDDITESDEELLGSDREEVKGQENGDDYPDVGELDYDDDLMGNEVPTIII